jgi:hypothetical protein
VSAEANRTGQTSHSGGARAGEYRESLRTPWWWYPVALAVASILAAEFHIADYSLTDWIPYSVLLPFSVVVVWWLGRSKLIITETELDIRGAHIALRFVEDVVALDARTLRRVIGREGDPLAFVSIRPWIGPGVQLQLSDPEDSTPYWIVSTRHPHEVAALIRKRRTGSAGGTTEDLG